MLKRRAGLTVIETALAVAIGMVLMSGVISGYYSMRRSSALSNARSMVGTIQTNIAMEKFRAGSPPPIVVSPGATEAVSTNQDSEAPSKQYFPVAVGTGLPLEPVTGTTTLLQYNSALSPAPLVAGDPTDRWDNPMMGSTGYGKGGWLYDPNTGAFRVNLSNHDYPGDLPGNW